MTLKVTYSAIELWLVCYFVLLQIYKNKLKQGLSELMMLENQNMKAKFWKRIFLLNTIFTPSITLTFPFLG